MSGFLSNSAQAHAGELASTARRKGKPHRKWSRREIQIVDVQGYMNKTVDEIATRLGKEGYSRSNRAIEMMLTKLKHTVRRGSGMVFSAKGGGSLWGGNE